MVRILVVLILIAIIVRVLGGFPNDFFKGLFTRSEYRSCPKCDGRGYWEVARNDRTKCDRCGGAGKIER